ncbi:putative Quinonprotein alcohol dehydrogenase-like protein [Trypanosoma cruzi]|uniref:Putative Quinonprotein alcohol dehydrogenase-like protein n=1 Tax=Trypanosoma cruzi TaxID=5693 RepID=A0A2V2VM48_TRYCR|nr:putative Quinonprotein alcohol dehydrogenase-like protein [Trypanosoma cruzi]
MSVGIYSLKAETNASSTGGSRGLNRMRRLPAIQLDSWEFRKHAREGSVMPNALVASDVDGDGVEEIVVGTTEGQILVVKPDHRMPIFSRTLAATISIVLYSATYRRLVLVTLEGTCEVTEGFLSGGCKVPPSASSNALQSKGQCDWGLPPSLEPSNHMNHSWGGHDEGKKSKTPSTSSHVFCIVPNCTCGDITAEVGGTTIFLGAHNCIYVYSIKTDGECLGSLLLQTPVTSMKCFTVPFATEGHLRIINSPLFPCRNAAATPQTTFDGSTPRNDAVFIGSSAQTVAGATLLLVSCGERLVLLNASSQDVKEWGGSGNLRCVATQECPLGDFPLAGGPNIHTAYSSSFYTTDVLNPYEVTGTRRTPLQPLWQCSMSRTSEMQQRQRWPLKSSMDEGHTQSGFFDLSTVSLPVSSPDTCNMVPREELLLSPRRQQLQRGVCDTAAAGALLNYKEDSETALDLLENDLPVSFAVDVAVSKNKLQFAIVSEDGRWLILEMSPACGEGSMGAVPRTLSTNQHENGNEYPPNKWFSATIVCLASGCLKPQWFLSCVCNFCVRQDEFCTVFLSTEGNCYLVGSNSEISESRLGADASSFTILKGGFMGNPVHPAWTSSNCATTTMPTGVSSALVRDFTELPQEQQQPSLLRASSGRGVCLVCVTLDEIVISSVGSELFLSAQQSSVPLAVSRGLNFAGGDGISGWNETRSSCGITAEGGAHFIDNMDEREEELMLQLGTALLEAEGYADPTALFSPEERRFAARMLCAAGYTEWEWELLWQMDAELSE